MLDTDPNSIRAIMSGDARGATPALLRAATGIVEPFYAGAMRLRNIAYDIGAFRSHDLGRPTISFGNITTGGTGKTPLVRWAAESLRDAGIKIAILSRGYGSTAANPLGDELSMLNHQLNTNHPSPIPLAANPDRVSGAANVLASHPDVQTFLLDDAFQHRRVKRDLDVVLINATEPFGFGHVIPRGLLREPLIGLRRANAVVLTHADRVSESEISRLESQISVLVPSALIYRASHKPSNVRKDSESLPLQTLSNQRLFGFCGIGTPAAFDRDISGLARKVGFRAFDDHHAYSKFDIEQLQAAAKQAGADALVTTEKDWVKLAPLIQTPPAIPILRLEMRVAFESDHEARLLQQMKDAIAGNRK